MLKRLTAEFLGTFWLVLGGCGSAVLAANFGGDGNPLGIGLLGVSLALGMIGYVLFENLSWLDAFLNAAMLLGGMGPVDMPRTDAGKLFAGLFALYSGLLFLVTASLVLAPVMHRVLHKFHWDEER